MHHSRLQSQNNNNDEQEIPFPPPPSFLSDNLISNVEQHPIIRATGPGLKDGFTDDNCLYLFVFSHLSFEILELF